MSISMFCMLNLIRLHPNRTLTYRYMLTCPRFIRSSAMCSSSASPESGLGTSHTSLPGSAPGSASEQQNEEMYYEAEPLQPLCMCKALYPFDGEYK